MKMKIIAIFVMIMTLLIGATVLPVAGNLNVIENQNQVVQDPLESEPQYREDEWPMFQHDLNNTGYSTSKAPQTSRVKWITHIEDAHGIESSPVIVNGKLYIGADDQWFYCLDAETGKMEWRSRLWGGTSVSSPAVYNGTVIQGSTFDYIYCWDADTGNVIWKFYKGPPGVNSGGSRSPAVADGKVYITINRGDQPGLNARVYCLNAETGDKIWVKNMGFYELTAPAVYDSKVYFGSEDKKMYCFDAENGNKLWDYNTQGKLFFCIPTLFNGRVYFCGDIRLNCLDAETGDEIWHFDGCERMSPAVAYNNLYFIGSSKLYCLDVETGVEIWNSTVGKSYAGSPAVADEKIYLGIRSTGFLLCLDAYTGEKLWEYQTHLPNWVFNSPAIAYGRVYIAGGLTDNIYCFEDLPSPNKPPYPPTITGETNGAAGVEYEYTFNAVDPNGDDVRYIINWDDLTSNITSFSPSGTDVTVSHIWSEEGTYTIRAKAEDIHGLVGPEATLTVTMPRNRQSNNHLLLKIILQQFPILQKILLYLIK